MDNVFELSDDDFAKLDAPPSGGAPATGGEQTDNTTATDDTTNTDTQAEGQDQNKGADEGQGAGDEGETTEAKTAADPEGAATPGSNTEAKPAATTPKDDTTSQGDKPGGSEKTAGEQTGQPKEGAKEQAAPVDYQAFAQEIMKPFKANGSTIEVKTPEEAVRLMQMGANYNKKMMELAPHRKAMLMLRDSNLLGNDEQLGFLLDLHKKDPEAIKKLIKDSGIDPLEIDTTTEPAYREGNHRVTDERLNFETVLDELRSSEQGVETIRHINSDWDQASKEALWKNAEIMRIINEQRINGMYSRIHAEVDRQRTLGNVAPEVPFVQAYYAVGKQMAEQNMFADLVGNGAGSQQETTPAQKQVAAPVATRAAAPKPKLANADKAAAASPSRPTPTAAKPVVNYFAMSDEEIAKMQAPGA